MPVPNPKFFTDFSNPDDPNNAPFELKLGAEIKDGAPGNVARALRIDRDGPFAILPGVDISPQCMKDCTFSITFYLESIPKNSRGWLLNHDNGGFDRCIALHDERFDGIGHGVGYKTLSGVYQKFTTPPIGKWIQMVMTYRQGGECAVFVSNEKAPITHIGKNNRGKKDLTIGCVDFLDDHWCDCWVKDLNVYDVGLSDEQVDELFQKFVDEVKQPTEPTTPPSDDPTTTNPDVEEIDPITPSDSSNRDDEGSNKPYIRPNAQTDPDTILDEDVEDDTKPPKTTKLVNSRCHQKCCVLLLLIIILLITSWRSLSSLMDNDDGQN